MNTANMPEEEELDRIFRQAADAYEPEFVPEAWQAMEQKLDAKAKPQSWVQKRWREGLLLLLVGLTSIFIYRQYPHPNTKPENPNKISAAAPESRNKVSANNKPDNSVKDPETVGERAKKEQITGLGNLITDPAKFAVPLSPSELGGKRPLIRKDQFTSNQALLSAKPNNYQPAPTLNPETKSGIINPENNASGLNTNQPLISVADSTEKQKQLATLPLTVAPADSTGRGNQTKLASEPENIPAQTASTPSDSAFKQKQLKGWSRWSIHLIIGPDFSTVGLVRPEQASTNVGGILSYQISARWAVSTGVVRARKVYGAKPEDYYPGANYWPPGSYLPNDINAVCQVLDIPVNIRYAVMALPKQTVYLQTGLSSYFMLKEDYRYDYDNYGQPYSKHWIAPRGNKHVLGVLNLALGYSRQIKPGIWVGAEPFVKVPLNGIGAGKVNLMSIGSFFSVGYQFR